MFTPNKIPVRKLKQILIPGFIILCFFVIYLNIPVERNYNNNIIYNSVISHIKISNYSLKRHETTNNDFIFHENYLVNQVNYNIHIFYYAWYGNEKIDGKWIHWNHKRMPHWNQGLINEFSQAAHIPPDDIGADFYPALGLYSSKNISIIQQHLQMIRYTGIGVVVLSWYSQNRSDPNGNPIDELVNIILNESLKLGLKVALHLEPYPRRSIYSLKEDLNYIYRNYANHSAYFKKPRFKSNKPLPVVFIYDSYLISKSDWIQIFGIKRPRTIRGKPDDFFIVGLLLDRNGCGEIFESGFDAGYSYFAGEQVSFSSASRHWAEINRKCTLKNIEFYPSIGPGYKDASVRPWNDFVTQDRENGQFFYKRFVKVKESGARSFGITSFNEWHEGTQIEPAVPHLNPSNRLIYENYLPNSPVFYLNLTRKFVNSFTTNAEIMFEQ